MKSHLFVALAWLATASLALPAAADVSAKSPAGPSLRTVLAAAMERGVDRQLASEASPYETSSWLAGLPSLGLTYLDSEQRDGTDEAELSLNLPLKSGRRRSADEALQGLTEDLDGWSLRLRQLYYSGLLREILWAYRLADARRRFAADKKVVLLELEQRQQELLAASATSEYALLLLQTELVEVEVAQQEYLQETRRWRQRYRQLTGLEEMPADVSETAPPIDDFTPGQHPRLRALELANQQHRQLLRANSAAAADWNLAFTAKNFETAGYDEQQYGLGVEIPLSALDVATESDNAQWRGLHRDYLLARDQVLNELRDSWEQLLNERDVLQAKQRLLERSEKLAGRIAEQLAQLQASNEIGQEILLRRMMSSIDTRAAVAVNRILLDQNNAMLRQAAGLSL
jgi:hypothetical protein